jgi:hypothetical protein
MATDTWVQPQQFCWGHLPVYPCLYILVYISLFIVLSNPRKIEVQKFKLVFVGVTLWFLGEFSYTYYQIVLDTDAPYPGVGEIFYVAGYGPLILFTYRSFKTIKEVSSSMEKYTFGLSRRFCIF